MTIFIKHWFQQKVLLTCFLCALAPLLDQHASAKVVLVSSPTELTETIQIANPGDVLELAPGSYGELVLNGNKPSVADKPADGATGQIILKASDINNPPEFSKIALNKVSGLRFSNVKLKAVFKDEKSIKNRYFTIKESDNITINDCILEGDKASNTATTADDFGSGIALSVVNSNFITLNNNTIHTWYRGAIFTNTNNLKVTKNDLFNLRSDGFDFAGVKNTEILQNHIHDFKRSPESPDHPDMIQFWTRNTKQQTENVLIQNNILDVGNGDWTQSIFMRNEAVEVAGAGTEMFYKNIRIEGNLIRNAHGHGITIGASDDLEIVSNTLIQSENATARGNVSVPGIRVGENSTNVVISRNITPRNTLKKSPPSWTIADNALAQRDVPQRDTFYTHVYVDALAAKDVTLADLLLMPGSELAKQGVGSPLSHFDEKPYHNIALIDNSAANATGHEQKLWISHAFGPKGQLKLQIAKIEWTFGDSGTATGEEVVHTFSDFGRYAVKAVIHLKSGETITSKRTIEVLADRK